MEATYRHERLTDQRDIRLLVILPGKDNDPIHCTCLHVSLAAVVKHQLYEAISYTWGKSVRDHHVFINSQDFPVTKNAHAVLQDMRYENQMRRVWLDAICINQIDNEEKNVQVGMMKDIYASVTHVVAWLGNASPDTPLAFRFMDRLNTCYEACTQGLGQPVPPYPVGNWGLSARDLREWAETNMKSPEWRALRALLKRPWFRRIWVLQEVVVAKRIWISCGHDSMDFQNFAPAIHWMMMHCQAHINLHIGDDPKAPSLSGKTVGQTRSGLQNLSQMHETRYNLHIEQRPLKLEDYLYEPTFWEAGDPILGTRCMEFLASLEIFMNTPSKPNTANLRSMFL